MKESDSISRFEELEAGRILGDLEADEMREWEELSKSHQRKPDFSLELTAAALETHFLEERSDSLPPGLALALRDEVPNFASDASRKDEEAMIIRPDLPRWRRVLHSGEMAWAVAALLTALLIATFLAKQPGPVPPPIVVSSPTEISPEFAKEEFLKVADDLTTAKFSGVGAYKGIDGEVVWSDDSQEGYMTLSNLPPNDPAKKQYQLWIVDPSRDDEPVDGGVFDIPADRATAVIPISNPLTVKNPQAFVITLEQPGGVVVSTQDVVVALAKPS